MKGLAWGLVYGFLLLTLVNAANIIWFDNILAPLTKFGSVLGGFAPFAAIIWAVYAFFGEKRASADARLRDQRQKIYFEYLSDISAASKKRSENKFSEASAALNYHDQLSVIAPDPVLKASQNFIKIVFETASCIELQRDEKGSGITFQTSSQREALRKYQDARKRLVNEMRRDVLVGSTVEAETPSDMEKAQ